MKRWWKFFKSLNNYTWINLVVLLGLAVVILAVIFGFKYLGMMVICIIYGIVLIAGLLYLMITSCKAMIYDIIKDVKAKSYLLKSVIKSDEEASISWFTSLYDGIFRRSRNRREINRGK
jgi:hypothetical protein